MIWTRKLKNKSSAEVNDKLWGIIFPFRRVFKTIVTDNGSEFARHEQITKGFGLPIFFANPYASWQKGAIEHANKLLRQYIPKRANFDLISQKELDVFCRKLNNRPRRKLNFNTLARLFFSLCP